MNKDEKRGTLAHVGNCANPELCEHLSHNDSLCQKCSNYRKKAQKPVGASETN